MTLPTRLDEMGGCSSVICQPHIDQLTRARLSNASPTLWCSSQHFTKSWPQNNDCAAGRHVCSTAIQNLLNIVDDVQMPPAQPTLPTHRTGRNSLRPESTTTVVCSQLALTMNRSPWMTAKRIMLQSLLAYVYPGG